MLNVSFLLNDDIIFKQTEKNVTEFLLKNQYTAFSCQALYNWSVFLLPRAIYLKVGQFDEGYKGCFFEDTDYQRRMELCGVRINRHEFFNPTEYQNSMSTKADPSLDNFTRNREFYIKKWGGPPLQEKYKVPYNLNGYLPSHLNHQQLNGQLLKLIELA